MEIQKSKAAVTLIYIESEDPEYLIIERAENPKDPWSGQIALPGGRLETADRNLLETAIRETFEETGIVLNHKDYLGPLERGKAGISNNHPMYVDPFLFKLSKKPKIRVDSNEVASIIWVKQTHLLNDDFKTHIDITHNGHSLSFPGIQIDKKILWGFTYAVLKSYFAQKGLRLPE